MRFHLPSQGESSIIIPYCLDRRLSPPSRSCAAAPLARCAVAELRCGVAEFAESLAGTWVNLQMVSDTFVRLEGIQRLPVLRRLSTTLVISVDPSTIYRVSRACVAFVTIAG
jgi:hypothetical protein